MAGPALRAGHAPRGACLGLDLGFGGKCCEGFSQWESESSGREPSKEMEGNQMKKVGAFVRGSAAGVLVTVALSLFKTSASAQASPTITRQPVSQTNATGSSATFSLRVAGTGPFAITIRGC